MNIEIIKDRMKAAQSELSKLEIKKSSINEKIKSKQELIDGYALQISQYEMNELTQSLAESGTSLNEVLQAMKNGDLSKIQIKVKHNIS